jgi:hypothetical protein
MIFDFYSANSTAACIDRNVAVAEQQSLEEAINIYIPGAKGAKIFMIIHANRPFTPGTVTAKSFPEDLGIPEERKSQVLGRHKSLCDLFETARATTGCKFKMITAYTEPAPSQQGMDNLQALCEKYDGLLYATQMQNCEKVPEAIIGATYVVVGPDGGRHVFIINTGQAHQSPNKAFVWVGNPDVGTHKHDSVGNQLQQRIDFLLANGVINQEIVEEYNLGPSPALTIQESGAEAACRQQQQHEAAL